MKDIINTTAGVFFAVVAMILFVATGFWLMPKHMEQCSGACVVYTLGLLKAPRVATEPPGSGRVCANKTQCQYEGNSP
jgi:hypothetical protein